MPRPASNKLLNLLRYGDETGPGAPAPKQKRASMSKGAFVRRHSRLLRVAGMLDADCSTEPDILARQLGIGRRTLYRDLALLRRAGIRLVYCREERRYRLDSLYMRLATELTKKEATAFIKWSAHRARHADDPLQPLERALAKIERILFDGL